jgi:LDH2 family malate/lactate/ureidoglycolate dehydrogenase
MTLDPSVADQLMPIGDYKGFGLSLMVEIMCGLLAGMPVGRDVSSMFEAPLSEKRYLGHFFGAIRIDAFEEPARFKARLQKLVGDLRSERPQVGAEPVQVAGDPEKKNQAERERDGIPLYLSDVNNLNVLGERLGLGKLQ